MIKRSLFWQLLVPVSPIFVLCIVVVALWIPDLMRQSTERTAVEQAEATVQQLKTLRAYYTENIIKKAKAAGALEPAIDHRGEAGRIPLPATMIHDLSALFSEQGMSIHLYSAFPFPNRGGRTLDDFGRDAWQALNENPEAVFSRTEQVEGKTVVRVAVADRMVNQVCVDCHNSRPDTPKNDWKIGDVRGVLEVAMPIDESLAAGMALSNQITAILVVAALLIFAVLHFVYRRTIGRKLAQLTGALREIAEGDGDLTRRLDESGKDELATVAHWFNVFVARIATLVGEMKQTTGQLDASATRLAQVAERSSAEVAEQQAQTEMLATAIDEMAAAVQEVARSTEDAARAAGEADRNAMEGRTIVEHNIESMDRLAAEIERAAEVIVRLRSETDEIGSVLDVIRGIAEQTNLLALNASIEAARAGEQGRGFAVVADEVRTLASRTQASTEEIHAMIERLQQRAGEAVAAMEQNRSQSEAGVATARKVDETLAEIGSAITRIADLNTQVASATEQQSRVAEEINHNIRQISQGNETAVEDARQVASASEALTRLATHLSELSARFRT